MKVRVLENLPAAPVGLFGRWLERRRGARLEVVTPDAVPEAPGDEDLLVILGASEGVYDDLPWIRAEVALARASIAAGRPVVGICFGAQVVASAIGGRSAPFGRRFFGLIENAEVAAPLWRGPWVRGHQDHVTLPPGCEVMARDQGTIQAFQYGSAVGVQFHPEADGATLRAWAAAKPNYLAEAGVTPAEIDAAAGSDAPGEAARDALFSEILRRVMQPALHAAR